MVDFNKTEGEFVPITVYDLIYACNDLQNANAYSVDVEGNCFYRGELIGKGKARWIKEKSGTYRDIEFKPITPTERLTIKVNITTDKSIWR